MDRNYLVFCAGVWGAEDSLEEAWTNYRRHGGSTHYRIGHIGIFKGKSLSISDWGALMCEMHTEAEKLYLGDVRRAPKRLLWPWKSVKR